MQDFTLKVDKEPNVLGALRLDNLSGLQLNPLIEKSAIDMLHFSKITTKGKDFNLIASGALAYKIHNKILKEDEFCQCKSMLHTHATSNASANNKNIFFVIISDLDKVNTESLCNMIAKERENGGYAVCEVIPMLYNELSFKALKMLRASFDEVLELGKFNLGGSKMLINAEQQNCIITDYSISMARMIYYLCVADEKAITAKRNKDLVHAD